MFPKKYIFLFLIGLLLLAANDPYQGYVPMQQPTISYSGQPAYLLPFKPANPLLYPPMPRVPFLQSPYSRLSFLNLQEAATKALNQNQGGINAIIQYEARDSITFDLQDKNFNLYGAGAIGYEDIKLDAENITLNWGNNTVIATGKYNETGEIENKPVFVQANNKYVAEEIRYNIDSKRGTASKLITKQDEAIIKANKAKVDGEDTYYADELHFTTCDLIKPHYHISASKVKYVKDKKIASGPFNFYFDDVPTPLGFFYGLLFLPRPRASGLIVPVPGEEAQNGFFLKNGGYYFYFSDYIDLALKGSIYSKGVTYASANSTYKKRYSYAGDCSYERNLTTSDSPVALQETKEKSWRFQWKHATLNNRISSLQADVDIQSQSFTKTTRSDNDKLAAKTNSRIKYGNNLVGLPYDFHTSLAHSKDFKTRVTNLVLPEIILQTGHIHPIRAKGKTIKSWYHDIYFKHTFEIKNETTNVVGGDTLDIKRENWPKIAKESKYGAKHTVPIETHIKLFRYFNLKPRFSYQERWYTKSLDYSYDAIQDTIVQDTISGFKRVYDYNWGADLETTIYGTHFFNPDALLQAFRHRLTPSVGFTYTPDFSKDKYDYWQKIQTPQGEKRFDKFHGFVYGGTKDRASAVLDFKVDNTLETKIKNFTNPNEKPKKVPILESLSLSSKYDFLADSFKLADIKLAARTRILDSLISIEYNADFDPYIYKNKKRVEEFAWQNGQGLGYIKTSSLKVSTSLRSSKGPETTQAPEAKQTRPAPSALLLPDDPNRYVDFDIPWQLQLTFDRRYTYQPEKDLKNVKRNLSFGGDLSLTQKWKIGFNSTYDIDKKELVGTATKLSIYRDLHCWQMNFDWHPLGTNQSYEFFIGIKAQMLQDIKYPRANEYKRM